MIFVTVGTHGQPFDRLVRAADELAAELGEEVIVQSGSSVVRCERAKCTPYFSPDEQSATISRARIVVTHAGPASIFEAEASGHRPIVVPRSDEFGEHVDDHQVRFARRLAGRVVVVEDVAALRNAVVDHGPGFPPRDPRPFAHRFGVLVDEVVERGRSRNGLGRATLTALRGLLRRS